MKKRWWVVSALLIGGLVVVALSLMKEPQGPEATLSDGTLVRFEKAGVGRIAYDSFPPLKAALAGFVPNQFQGRLGERIQSWMSPFPSHIGLLFSTWTADGQRKRESAQFLSRLEFVESTGFVFHSAIGVPVYVGNAMEFVESHRYAFHRSVSGYNTSSGVMLIDEGSFPRREATLHMRLYEQQTDRLLFDLHVPNPGYKPAFDEWTPEAVPATQTVKPLTVTLKNGPANIPANSLREEDIEITSTDPRWTTTRPQRQVWLTDATGNKAYEFSGLSPFEPAWKLHIRVRRSAEAEFGADEVWRTNLIEMPAALKAERLKLAGVAAGVEFSTAYVTSAGEVRDDGTTLTVTSTRISSPGGTSSGSGVENGKRFTLVDSPLPHIQLSHTPLDEETDLIIVVKDQAGRNLSNDHSGSSVSHQPGGIWSRIVQFQPAPETTEVQLEVTVNRGRTFEFLVAPRKPDAMKVTP